MSQIEEELFYFNCHGSVYGIFDKNKKTFESTNDLEDVLQYFEKGNC